MNCDEFSQEVESNNHIEEEQDIEKENDVVKAENEKDTKLFCICRSSDIDRFMIACDKCMEWFHGDCVNIENKRAARKIEEWYCQQCLDSYEGLQIVFKDKRIEERKESQKKKKIENYDEKFDDISKLEDKDFKRKRKNSDTLRRKNRTCGVCASCTNEMDCGQCDFCADMKKFGGPGKLRQKCRAKQCLFLSRVRKKNDQVHREKKRRFKELSDSSDSVNTSLTTSTGKLLTNYLTLSPVLEQEPNEQETDDLLIPQKDHCYSAPCQNNTEQMPNDKIPDDKIPIDKIPLEEHVKKKSLKVKRATAKKMSYSERYSEPVKYENETNSKRETIPYHDKLATNRTTRSSRKEREVITAQQCLGPGCVNSARNSSKYCSSECGIQLQIRRLQVILPTRMKSLQKGYHSTQLANEEIKKLRLIQKKCQDELVELDKLCHDLENLQEKSKGLSIQEEEENDEERDTDLDLTMYCVTCGVALAPRIAFKHMEKCWAKVECLMSFGAVMRSAGNLFCDSYINAQGTYCKRLKVMCPEHFKETKIDSDMVCGCPLVDSEFHETGKFCRISKRKCTRHVSWYRLRRGEIDLRRVHQWWKLEDALEQERQLRFEISNRNDVVGILLHDTIDHSEVLESNLTNDTSLNSIETEESLQSAFYEVDR
ncbi:CXXC-type zinc finger protein 1 isoform X1 [Hydra vulgaris]|uniref:CXXC-type zinc finger protein 1 n=1 Tax=Hydra vulgaris TaxID=6087 RepID=T2M429_HYDVU|nr:CXXC-type zinc finger protein 1 isoform X1 [Hydra vulgaris]